MGYRTCALGKYCTNQRFQKRQYAKIDRFETKRKGFGIRAKRHIKKEAFIIEYCGEVISLDVRLMRSQSQLFVRRQLIEMYVCVGVRASIDGLGR
jgi:hypothetical protein